MANFTVVVDDTQIPVELLEAQKTPSKHSGKMLARLTITFDWRGDVESEKNNYLQSPERPVRALNPGGQEIGIFRVAGNSYNYRDGIPLTTYRWELEEVENLNANALVLGEELTLAPYRYEESFVENSLRIEADVKLSEDQERSLRSLPRYFSVVRQGVSDVPKEMRLGRLVWSQDSQKEFRIRLILVEKVYDDMPFAGFLEPEISNIQAMLAETCERLTSLLRLMERKGVISSTELNDVSNPSPESIASREKEFSRVDDLDKYPI